MKKRLYKEGIRIAAVLTVLILMTGCSKEKLQPSSESASITSGETSETKGSTESAADSDSSASHEPEVSPLVFYHGDIRLSPELQADIGHSSVDIPNYKFTYYETLDGQKKYHLIIEFKNTGTTAVYTPRAIISLYDSDNHLLPIKVLSNYVYGIMAPGETDYIFADGDLWEQGVGPIDIDLSKGLVPVIEEMNVNECDLSEHTFFEFDTDVEMKITNRYTFSGTVTNPFDKDITSPDVYFLLFNANDEIVGIVQGRLGELSAKQTKEISYASLQNLEITLDQVDHFVTRAGYWEFTGGH